MGAVPLASIVGPPMNPILNGYYLTLGFTTAPVSQEEHERMNGLGWKGSDPRVVPFLAVCDGPAKPSRPATLAERDIMAAAAFSFLEMLDQDWRTGHFEKGGRGHTLSVKLFGDDRRPMAASRRITASSER
jgi:hypothetical protein